MSDPDAPDLDPAALLGAFQRHGVAFIAVGGFAARLHGARLCLDWDPDNLDRAAAALRELSARLKIGVYVQVPIDSALLRRMEVATWRTPVGDIDLLWESHGTADGSSSAIKSSASAGLRSESASCRW